MLIEKVTSLAIFTRFMQKFDEGSILDVPLVTYDTKRGKQIIFFRQQYIFDKNTCQPFPSAVRAKKRLCIPISGVPTPSSNRRAVFPVRTKGNAR